MINLARRDVLHGFGRFVFTGLGLGLLIGLTLSMAGIYRGLVDDGQALLDIGGADLWVVQQATLGPYAEPSSIPDDVYRSLLGIPGVAAAGNVTYLTMQVARVSGDVRVMLVGFEPGRPGEPGHLIAGRPIARAHYEAIADVRTGLAPGDRVRIRRHDYTIVGLTQRMVSASGDPMLFVPLRDAQDVQFRKDNDALVGDRARIATNPAFDRPGMTGIVEAVQAGQAASRSVNAVLLRLEPGIDATRVAEEIRRWKRLEAYTRADMGEIVVAKMIASSARQIFLFLVILSVVSAAIVAFIIYTMTQNKVREIAVLKLIGARNRTIAGMILQQALALGAIGFIVGRTAAGLWAPIFPKYVLLLPGDALRGVLFVLAICALASLVAIRAALRVDPATAIGG
jgi:putative ABC transport system permease protein